MSAVTYGREKAVQFGANKSLVGILTEAPAGVTEASSRPAVIFLNSGILHRVGSCRLHVRMAREFSTAGFHAFRFDFSGIGDSEQRRDSLPFEESAVLETREAMDYLAKTKGVKQFVLIGLCSGADMAHETAVVDERVVGLVLLDAWAYKTLAYQVRRIAPKLLDIGAWTNAIRVRVQERRGVPVAGRSVLPGGDGVEYEVPKYVRVFPPRDKVAAELRAMTQRGVAFNCVWTGGLVEYNHEGQHAATFSDVPFGNKLRETWLRDADHIVTGLDHQQWITSESVAWLCSLTGVPRPTEKDLSSTTPPASNPNVTALSR